jgi:hypothetical protein
MKTMTMTMMQLIKTTLDGYDAEVGGVVIVVVVFVDDDNGGFVTIA